MRKELFAGMALLAAAMIWGAGFVFQNMAMEHIGPFTLGCLRFFIGSVVVFPLTRIKKFQPEQSGDIPASRYWIGGFICGLCLFFGTTFQQYGIMQTTAGKAGFVTALYVVLVPFFVWIVFKRRVSAGMWAVVAAALMGVFLLCVSETLVFNTGDMLVFIGTFFWALQIIALEHFGKNANSIKLSVVQFLTCAVLSAVPMVLFEQPTIDGLRGALIPLIYGGAISVAVGFTAQVVGLKHTGSVMASILLSTEAVFAALFGFLLLGELLTERQLAGCTLVFAAVVTSELLPARGKKRRSD